MPHFKAPNDTLHFLSDEDILNGGLSLLPEDAIEITEAQADAIRAAQRAAAEAAAPAPVPVQNAEQKLAAFLSANPDVMKLIQGAA